MERGEDWEYTAVQARWTTIERQRRVAKRFAVALSLWLIAAICLLGAFVSKACIHGLGTQNTCVPVIRGPLDTLLIITSIVAFGGGLWLCRAAVSLELRLRHNGS